MPALKIGIQIASLRQPFRQVLAAAHRLGVQGVELDARGELRPSQMTETAARQVRNLLDDYGLRVAAVSLPTRRGYDVAEEIEARVTGTKDAIKLAYQLEAPLVLLQLGAIPAEPEGPQWNQLLEVLSDFGAIFAPRRAHARRPDWCRKR